MPDLSGVTLACIDTVNHALAVRALSLSMRSLQFGSAMLLTDALPANVALPAGIELRPIERLTSREHYSRFVLKSLLPHISTPHVLLIQWDGYVVNPQAFDAAFLTCDYIGAKWFWFDDGMRIGNGGFSLRSRRLLEALQDPRVELVEAEDFTIGRTFRPLLEREHGVRFADDALADKFAFEAAYPIGMPFGFHGLYNFCRVVAEEELAALAPQFSDAIAASLQLGQLLRNCVALGQWRAAIALAKRRLAVLKDDRESKALLARAEVEAASGPVVGRNDPCPCGSGKRYKQCHGSLGNNPSNAAPKAAPSASPSALALAQRGVELHRKGDLQGAEREYREALRVEAEHPLAMHFLGVAHYQRMRFDEALPLLQRSTDRVPQEPEFHNNLGLVFAALDRNEEAIASYKKTLALARNHGTAWNNLGLALQAINRIGDAIDAFRRAIAIAPGFAHAHWNLALALLANGEYHEGWQEYEWRLRLPELGGRAPALPIPRWSGQSLAGKTLLLTAEQGIGDAVQFIRFAPAVAQSGAHVIVRAPSSVAALLANADAVGATIADNLPLPASDFELPLVSLAHRLDVDASMIGSARYLRTEPAAGATVLSKLGPARTGRRRIGIVWAGAPHHQNDRRRSMPFEAVLPLFDLPGIDWVSLQKGPREAEIEATARSKSIVRLDASSQLSDTAALIDALDAVVSVDTSVAHITGALGKPLHLMLPFAADWRWGIEGARTAWYESAMLYRQNSIGNWSDVVADVTRALNAGN
jgi:tetratricopeptide (TPR) repeat protein